MPTIIDEKELIAAQEKAIREARSLSERADKEKRDMSAEEREQFDKLVTAVEDHSKQLDELAAQRDDEPDDEERDDEPGSDDKEEKDEQERKERSSRLDRLDAQLRGRSTGRISRLRMGDDGTDFRSEKKYLKAYRHWLKTGYETRDLSLGTNSAGGYLVTPTKLADDIVIAINNLVFIRQMANITRLTDAKSLGNPQLTADVQDITWGDEVTVSAADSTMTFGRRDLTPIMATNLVKASYRELQASPRAEDVIRQRIALSFAYGEEKQYLTGDGSGHPLGVFVASASGISTGRDVTATGASHSIAADDVRNMQMAIAQQYQDADTFVWVLHRDAVKQVWKLKDGQGQWMWQQNGYMNGMTGKRSPTLDGIRVCQSEYAPNTFSTNAYIAVLGDFSYYRIAETMDMEIQRLVELYAATGQIGFLARKFVDGSPVLESAFARLKLA